MLIESCVARCRDEVKSRVPAPSGWFDSSFDLRSGLEVCELWSDGAASVPVGGSASRTRTTAPADDDSTGL